MTPQRWQPRIRCQIRQPLGHCLFLSLSSNNKTRVFVDRMTNVKLIKLNNLQDLYRKDASPLSLNFISDWINHFDSYSFKNKSYHDRLMSKGTGTIILTLKSAKQELWSISLTYEFDENKHRQTDRLMEINQIYGHSNLSCTKSIQNEFQQFLYYIRKLTSRFRTRA